MKPRETAAKRPLRQQECGSAAPSVPRGCSTPTPNSTTVTTTAHMLAGDATPSFILRIGKTKRRGIVALETYCMEHLLPIVVLRFISHEL